MDDPFDYYSDAKERFTLGVISAIETFLSETTKERKKILFRLVLEKDMSEAEINFWAKWHGFL